MTYAHEPGVDGLEDVLLILEALGVKLVGVEGGHLPVVPAGPDRFVTVSEPDLNM